MTVYVTGRTQNILVAPNPTRLIVIPVWNLRPRIQTGDSYGNDSLCHGVNTRNCGCAKPDKTNCHSCLESSCFNSRIGDSYRNDSLCHGMQGRVSEEIQPIDLDRESNHQDSNHHLNLSRLDSLTQSGRSFCGDTNF